MFDNKNLPLINCKDVFVNTETKAKLRADIKWECSNELTYATFNEVIPSITDPFGKFQIDSAAKTFKYFETSQITANDFDINGQIIPKTGWQIHDGSTYKFYYKEKTGSYTLTTSGAIDIDPDGKIWFNHTQHTIQKNNVQVRFFDNNHQPIKLPIAFDMEWIDAGPFYTEEIYFTAINPDGVYNIDEVKKNVVKDGFNAVAGADKNPNKETLFRNAFNVLLNGTQIHVDTRIAYNASKTAGNPLENTDDVKVEEPARKMEGFDLSYENFISENGATPAQGAAAWFVWSSKGYSLPTPQKVCVQWKAHRCEQEINIKEYEPDCSGPDCNYKLKVATKVRRQVWDTCVGGVDFKDGDIVYDLNNIEAPANIDFSNGNFNYYEISKTPKAGFTLNTFTVKGSPVEAYVKQHLGRVKFTSSDNTHVGGFAGVIGLGILGASANTDYWAEFRFVDEHDQPISLPASPFIDDMDGGSWQGTPFGERYTLQTFGATWTQQEIVNSIIPDTNNTGTSNPNTANALKAAGVSVNGETITLDLLAAYNHDNSIQVANDAELDAPTKSMTGFRLTYNKNIEFGAYGSVNLNNIIKPKFTIVPCTPSKLYTDWVWDVRNLIDVGKYYFFNDSLQVVGNVKVDFPWILEGQYRTKLDEIKIFLYQNTKIENPDNIEYECDGKVDCSGCNNCVPKCSTKELVVPHKFTPKNCFDKEPEKHFENCFHTETPYWKVVVKRCFESKACESSNPSTNCSIRYWYYNKEELRNVIKKHYKDNPQELLDLIEKYRFDHDNKCKILIHLKTNDKTLVGAINELFDSLANKQDYNTHLTALSLDLSKDNAAKL